MQVSVWLLLPTALLLPPAAWSGEIIGGREARPHSRPYMAYLEIKDGNRISCCGGFLVSEYFVLTAAHCDGDEITVHLGVHNLRSKRERRRQVIPVDLKIPHPQFDRQTQDNDIMLLLLEDKAELNNHVGLISLPRAHQRVSAGTVCSVAGWGQTSADSELYSDKLQVVGVMVLPDATCTYLCVNYDPYMMLCAGDPGKGKNSFKGDSGGPLVCRRTAQGIVSRGPMNGAPPAVYTKVSTFVHWIEETMKKLKP